MNFVVLTTVSILCISGRNRSCTSHTKSAVFDGESLPTALLAVAAREEDILIILLLLVSILLFCMYVH